MSGLPPDQTRPIYNAAAELAVLGSMISHPNQVMGTVNARLTAAHFFVPAHKHVFEAIRHLHNTGSTIDILTVHQLLADRKQAEEVGSPGIVSTAVAAEVSHLNIDAHIDLILQKAPLQLAKYQESDAADFSLLKMPPIKTVGSDWFAYRQGVWTSIRRDIFRPIVLSVLAPSIQTEKRVRDVLGHIESRSQVDEATLRGVHYLDSDGRVILNAANAILKIGPDYQIAVLPHDKDNNFTRQTAAAYNRDAKCPTFERVIREALPDPDDQRLLQLFVGSIFFPSTKYEAALICYGPGGTGKSTIGEAISNTLGTGLVERLSMAQVCDPKSYYLPKLRYAALNLGTELDALEVGESGNFKAVVSGEAVEVRPIYGHPYVMSTTTKLWFLSNHMPRFKNGTDAELRRMRFLRFGHVPAARDPELKAKLFSERDGIFQWALDGLSALMSMSEMPLGGAESQAVRERFAISNDPLGEFVSTQCVIEPEAETAKEKFVARLKEFCQTHAISCDDDSWLFKQLKNRWPQIKESQRRMKEGRIRVLRGIRLV